MSNECCIPYDKGWCLCSTCGQPKLCYHCPSGTRDCLDWDVKLKRHADEWAAHGKCKYLCFIPCRQSMGVTDDRTTG